jgi:hypothetical protein
MRQECRKRAEGAFSLRTASKIGRERCGYSLRPALFEQAVTIGPENAMSIGIGYLLPTRERVMVGQPQAAPLLELAERAERLGFDSVWAGDSLLARERLPGCHR